jgi:hypothetical protein
MVYKVSYIVQGQKHPGTIRNETEYPQVGNIVTIGKHSFEILEVLELVPPRQDFAYLHVTCRMLD